MRESEFILKVIAMRKRLITSGKSRRDEFMVRQGLKEVDGWVSFWKPSDEQIRNYMRKKFDVIDMLIPGDESPVGKKYRELLKQWCA